MPDTKITALTALTAADPANDVLPIVDVSDTTMAASGTTKKISINNVLGASGTATFSTLTVSGAATAQRFIPSSATVPSNGMYLPAANELGWAINSAEAMRLNSTGLGVGYTPSGSADKLGSAATLGVVATGATADLNFRNSSLTSIQRIRYTDATGVLTIGSATGTAYPVELGGSTSARAVTIDSSGNVGIGVTSLSRKFEVHGTPVTIGGTATGMLVTVANNGTAYNASPTSGFALWNKFNTSGSLFPSAAIQAGKENATDGNYAGFLSLYTVNSVGTPNEQMRIDSSGNVISNVTGTAPTLATNSQMVFNLTSNTNLRISVRGTDGTTRTADITLA